MAVLLVVSDLGFDPLPVSGPVVLLNPILELYIRDEVLSLIGLVVLARGYRFLSRLELIDLLQSPYPNLVGLLLPHQDAVRVREVLDQLHRMNQLVVP